MCVTSYAAVRCVQGGESTEDGAADTGAEAGAAAAGVCDAAGRADETRSDERDRHQQYQQ